MTAVEEVAAPTVDPDLAAYIERTVAAAPPLTREQADELAVLFRRERKA